MRLAYFIVFLVSILTGQILFGQSSNPVGSAYSTGDDCYVVTNDILWELGAVWFNESLNLNEPFEISLDVNLGLNDGGADGLVFVFQQVGTGAIGEPGGGLGFEGFSPSLGIEMDTYQNFDFFSDPPEDHMAILRDGIVDHNAPSNLSGPVPLTPTFDNVEDGEFHKFKITWNPDETILEVYFDCILRLSYESDLTNEIFNGDPIVYWGFTGATGGLSNIQTVCISEFALGLQDEYSVCAGEEIQLGVTGGQDGTFQWFPTDYLDDPNSANPIASPDESINYTVTYSDACGEEFELETSISVFDVSVDLPEEISICEDEVAEIEVLGNADTYEWSTGDTEAQIETVETGTIEVIGFLGGCQDSDSIEITQYETPSFTNLESTYEACEGDEVILDASIDIAGEILWSNGESESTIIIDESVTLEAVATSTDGCQASESVEVSLYPYPVSELPVFIEACDGDVLELYAGVADSYAWNTDELSADISVTENGLYTVILESNNCLTESSTEVIFNPNPNFAWPQSVEFCQGDFVELPIPESSYDWFWEGQPAGEIVEINDFGTWEIVAVDPISGCSTWDYTQAYEIELPIIELPETAVLCPEIPLEIVASVEEYESAFWDNGQIGLEIEVVNEGIYTLTVENECGSVNKSIEVSAEICDCELYVPNAFTPDLDGINEVYKPHITCEVDEYHFSVFNRWGEVIFETESQSAGWNGEGKAETHWNQGGIYTWQVEYSVVLFDTIETVFEQGTLVLIR